MSSPSNSLLISRALSDNVKHNKYNLIRYICYVKINYQHKLEDKFMENTKSKTTALILSVLVGGLGVDRFYLGYTGLGVLKLLTAGCFGILWIIDIVNIATGKLLPADGSKYDEDMTIKSSQNNTVPAANTYDDLEKIAKLHDQGILNDEEFNRMKAELLRKI